MTRILAFCLMLSMPLVASAGGTGAEPRPVGDWVGCYAAFWPDGSIRHWGYLWFSVDEDGHFTGRGDLTDNPATGDCAGYWTMDITRGRFLHDGRPLWFADVSDGDNNVVFMATSSSFDGSSWSIDYRLPGVPGMEVHADLWPGLPIFKDLPGGVDPFEHPPEVVFPSCAPSGVAPYCATAYAVPGGD